ncbi:hypothetical protein Tco_0675466, partial [Tanacetum coccineum]
FKVSGDALETLFVAFEGVATLNLDFATTEVAPNILDFAAIGEYKVNNAEGVSAAREEVSTAELMIDYALWEVIENDATLPKIAVVEGVEKVMPITSAEDTTQRRLERYLEDKPNVQGLGHEWYFDLDYLTDSLGYTRFKTKQPAGPKVHEASDMVESSSDYAEELARLQKQAFEANATAEKHLSQADLAASRNRVPTGKVDTAAGVSDGPTEHCHQEILLPSTLANSMSSSSEMEDIHHHSDTGIFSSSSYDDDFGGTVTNLAPSVAVDSVPTKRVNTIHPQSQILGDLTSPVQTRDIH